MMHNLPTSHKTSSSIRIIRIVILMIAITITIGSSVWMFISMRAIQMTTYQGAIATIDAKNAKANTADAVINTVLTEQASTEMAISHATATAYAEPDPYANGKLTITDNLTSDQSSTQSWKWLQSSGCAFQNNSYHTIDTFTSIGYISICKLYSADNNALSFDDFTLEIKMTILQGDVGGVFFRQSTSTEANARYALLIDKDGNYHMVFYTATSRSPTELTSGSSSAFHTGYGQTNTIALVARGSSLSWFINAQQAGRIEDGRYQRGSIGVLSANYINHTTGDAEAAYTDFKIWQLE